MARSWNLIEQNPELKKQLAVLFQLMGEEEGHKQGVEDREAKGEQNPALGGPGATPGISSGSSSMQRSGSSGAIQVPGAYGMPQGLYDELNREGAYDYLNQNFAAPDPAIGQAMGDINQTYQTGVASAEATANEPYNLGKSTLMEKILMGAGVAGLGAAAFGGKRVNPQVAGLAMGLGFGAAKGAPGEYRGRQDRRLTGELNRLGTQRKADLSPWQTQLGQHQLGQDVLGKNITQDNFMAGMGMELGGFGIRASEAKARRSGGNRYIPYDKQLYYEALEYMKNGGTRDRMRFDLSDAHAAVYEDYGPTGDTDPSQLTASQLSGLAGKEFEAKGEGLKTQFQDYMGANYPDEYKDWTDKARASGTAASLSDLAGTAKSDRLMLEDKQWPESNVYGADATAASLADSMMHYRDQSNLPGYQLERAADTAWVNARQPKVKGKSKRRWAPTSPDQHAKEWGFDSVQAAMTDLEAKKDTLSPEDYKKYRQMLGY